MLESAISEVPDPIPPRKRRQTVWAGGHTLRAEWHKPRTQATASLVFLHEGLGSISQWRDVPDSLGDTTGYGVLVYDRFGYGGSARLPIPYERAIDFMECEATTTVPDLLDTFDITNAFLFGHSDGATIALLATAGGDVHIQGIVAEATHLFVERESLDSIRFLRTQWEATDLHERLRRHHGDNVDGAFLGWANLWLNPAFASFDIHDRLAGVTCPVLAIQGTEDAYGSLAQVEVIKRSVSAPVDTLILSACGHSPHLEARAVVMDRVANFLATNLRR